MPSTFAVLIEEYLHTAYNPERGYDLKRLIGRIAVSKAYHMVSVFTQEPNMERLTAMGPELPLLAPVFRGSVEVGCLSMIRGGVLRLWSGGCGSETVS